MRTCQSGKLRSNFLRISHQRLRWRSDHLSVQQMSHLLYGRDAGYDDCALSVDSILEQRPLVHIAVSASKKAAAGAKGRVDGTPFEQGLRPRKGKNFSAPVTSSPIAACHVTRRSACSVTCSENGTPPTLGHLHERVRMIAYFAINPNQKLNAYLGRSRYSSRCITHHRLRRRVRRRRAGSMKRERPFSKCVRHFQSHPSGSGRLGSQRSAFGVHMAH